MKQFKVNDREHKKEDSKENEKCRKWIRRILIVILILFLLWLLTRCAASSTGEKEEVVVTDFFDSNAQTGSLPGRSEEEIQAELNKVVAEGMFNISIASVVTVEQNSDEAQVRIENIAANHHHMKVSITLDGEDEPIYESAGLTPGQYMEYVRLNRMLPAGTYSATAMFTAYHMEDLSQAGQAAAKITIVAGS